MSHGISSKVFAVIGIVAPIIAAIAFVHASSYMISCDYLAFILAVVSALLLGAGVLFFVRYVTIPYSRFNKLFLAVGIPLLIIGYYVSYHYGTSLASSMIFHIALFNAPIYLVSWAIGSFVGQELVFSVKKSISLKFLIKIIAFITSRILLLIIIIVAITVLLGFIAMNAISISMPLVFKDKALLFEGVIPRITGANEIVDYIKAFIGDNKVIVNYITGHSALGKIRDVINVTSINDLMDRVIDLPNGLLKIDRELMEKISISDKPIDVTSLVNIINTTVHVGTGSYPKIVTESPSLIKILLDHLLGPLIHMIAPIISNKGSLKILVGFLFIIIGYMFKGGA